MSGGTSPTPYIERGRARLWVGDVRDVLRSLPAESVHCVVTSPPYWGLRDYGVDGQIGLEPTPAAYVAKMVEVFREVRWVLRDDGTCWVNLGDSYTSAGGGGEARMAELYGNRDTDFRRGVLTEGRSGKRPYAEIGLKPKDLVGIPWRVAFALQADGWWLRSEIIWSKPNPMPESVTDRPTKAHEQLFLLSKAATYYYDQEAIRESVTGNAHARGNGVNPKALASGYAPGQDSTNLERLHRQDGPGRVKVPAGWDTEPGGHGSIHRSGRGKSKQNESFSGAVCELVSSRNKRTVWEIPTEPFPAAHFATYPTALVEPCIKAGTSERGCCPECGAPWRRVTSTNYRNPGNRSTNGPRSTANRDFTAGFEQRLEKQVDTLGWQPTCSHDAEPVPCVVLDPFAGSGTTLAVAQQLGRIGWGIELNREYADLAGRTRLAQEVLPL